jgi:hypothetical protein
MPSRRKSGDVYRKSGVKIRNELSLPLMESLKQWLEETLLKLSEKSLTINRIEELLPWNLATSTEPERSQVA